MPQPRIVFEIGPFYVTPEGFGRSQGYAVYENGLTHATRRHCASWGADTAKALTNAIAKARELYARSQEV